MGHSSMTKNYYYYRLRLRVNVHHIHLTQTSIDRKHRMQKACINLIIQSHTL